MIDIAYQRLSERAKELKCIYKVEELLRDENESLDYVFNQLLNILPPAWQYSTICEVRIIYKNKSYLTEDFKETEWFQKSDIIIDNNIEGEIQVYYTQFIRLIEFSQFLPDEQKLLNTIAQLLSNFIFHKRLKQTLEFIQSKEQQLTEESSEIILPNKSDEHWKWRLKMAQNIAYKMNFNLFGVLNVYIIGSTKNAQAGPASDIDLLVHFNGSKQQKQYLQYWIEGWSYCLSEMNYIKTGYVTDGLIDLHIITDMDIKNKTSFGKMLTSLTNGATLLR